MAAQFTAANSEYLSIADNAALSLGDVDFTFATRIYLDSLGTNQSICNKYGGTNWEFDINVITSNYIQFSYNSEGTTNNVLNSSPFGALSASTWYFVICEYDSTNDRMRIYINDTLANTRTSVTGAIDTNSPVQMGSLAGAQYFNGRRECTGYWKRLLTAAEKTALYNNNVGVAYADLPPAVRADAIAYWEMNEEAGTRYDQAGTNHLTDNNTVTSAAGTCLNAVGTWVDLSGKGRHAVQSTQAYKPVFRMNALNGKPAIKFDGTNDRMTVDASVGPTKPFHIFFAGKLQTATAVFKNVIGMSQNTSVDNWFFGWDDASTNTKFEILNTAGFQTDAATFTNPHIMSLSVQGNTATSEFRTSGVSKTGTLGVVNSNAIYLGARAIGGTFQLFTDYFFGEVIIYDRLLNSMEVRRLENYLTRKWGIPVI